MRTLLVLLIVLVIGLIIGDRVGVVFAQNEIAKHIQTEYNLSAQPRVSIGGIPFLTQALSGSYHDIDVRVGDWSVQKVSVEDVDVALKDVSASIGDVMNGRTSAFVAGTATATALVTYDTVQTYAPSSVESLSYGADGLSVKGNFPVGGVSVPATVVVTVSPTDEGIEITPTAVKTVAGGIPIPLASLRKSLTFTVPLKQLPLGAKLTGIQPDAKGLKATAVAQNVHFSEVPASK
ncbi:LmeA family phospholipid-binding protein [Nocardia sp. NPDC004722]